jgi:hypothetical protein
MRFEILIWSYQQYWNPKEILKYVKHIERFRPRERERERKRENLLLFLLIKTTRERV